MIRLVEYMNKPMFRKVTREDWYGGEYEPYLCYIERSNDDPDEAERLWTDLVSKQYIAEENIGGWRIIMVATPHGGWRMNRPALYIAFLDSYKNLQGYLYLNSFNEFGKVASDLYDRLLNASRISKLDERTVMSILNQYDFQEL